MGVGAKMRTGLDKTWLDRSEHPLTVSTFEIYAFSLTAMHDYQRYRNAKELLCNSMPWAYCRQDFIWKIKFTRLNFYSRVPFYLVCLPNVVIPRFVSTFFKTPPRWVFTPNSCRVVLVIGKNANFGRNFPNSLPVQQLTLFVLLNLEKNVPYQSLSPSLVKGSYRNACNIFIWSFVVFLYFYGAMVTVKPKGSPVVILFKIDRGLQLQEALTDCPGHFALLLLK